MGATFKPIIREEYVRGSLKTFQLGIRCFSSVTNHLGTKTYFNKFQQYYGGFFKCLEFESFLLYSNVFDLALLLARLIYIVGFQPYFLYCGPNGPTASIFYGI